MKSRHYQQQNLLNLYLRDKMNTVQHPLWTWVSGTIFPGSVPLTMSSFSSSSFLNQLLHLLKFNMLPLFFFQICQCTKEAHEKKQLHCYQQELLQLQIWGRAPAWSWVTGDLSGKGISRNIGTLKPEGWMALGWQIGYPMLTWRSKDHT